MRLRCARSRARIGAMPPAAKLFILLGALAGAAGVALGAFGAHALKARLAPDMHAVWQTAVQYHFWHALGLVAIGMLIALALPGSTTLKWAGGLMIAGLVLFSGSLYALAFTGSRWLGAVTPFGGTAWIVAWLLLAWAVLRS
jgi:uncharacterized membrane protein YgdD (TMEM256/DUF423 family)